MTLLKAEHNENGIWYFSTIRKAASFIDSADSNVNAAIKARRKVKGWEFEWIESDDVLSKYIDPKRQ